MTKTKTCVETLKDMASEIQGYPIVFKAKGCFNEFVAIADNKEEWSIYTYKSHGHIFKKIAGKLSGEQLADIRLQFQIGY